MSRLKLRAAAAKFRKGAEGATDGPWRRAAECELGSEYPPNFLANWDGAYLQGVAEFGDGDQAERDSRWAALTHPGLAKSLPDLLEAVADLITAHRDLEHPHVDGEPCDDLACRIVHHALAVADTLGGEV